MCYSRESQEASIQDLRSFFSEHPLSVCSQNYELPRPLSVVSIVYNLLDRQIRFARSQFGHRIATDDPSPTVIGRALGYSKSDAFGGRCNPFVFFHCREQIYNRMHWNLLPTLPQPCPTLLTKSIDDIANFASDATPKRFYQRNSHIGFAFEVLDKHDWNRKVKPFVDDCVEQSTDRIWNILERMRTGSHAGHKIIPRHWCLFRFKALSSMDSQNNSTDLALDERTQLLMFIALENLSSANGSFMDMQKGHWICIDGRQSVNLPPTGGGKGIYIVLDI